MSSSHVEKRWEATGPRSGGGGGGSSGRDRGASSRGYSRHGEHDRAAASSERDRAGGSDRKRHHRGYENDRDGHRRSRHSDYDHRRRHNHHRHRVDDDWKCYECSTWNDPRDGRCRRCGRHSEPSPPEDRARAEFGRGYDGVDERRWRRRDREDQEEEHLDEFGRPQQKSSSRRQDEEEQDELDEFGRPMMKTKDHNGKEERKAKDAEKGPAWPPPFDKRSTTYEFDTRSGMFYHAPSNFFYDPRSKLYFGHKTQQYYQYDSEKVPPFQQVKQQDEEEKGKKNSADSGVEAKPKIAIALKTKSFNGKKSSKKTNKRKEEAVVEQVKLAPVVTKTEIATQQNLNRWSGRQQEVASTDEKAETPTCKIYRAKTDNKPICLLCRRKFRDVDHLRRHEQESEMHKANVEKKKAKVSKESSNNNNSSYRDRAMERRILHGPMDVVATAADGSNVAGTPATVTTPADPDRALDASNVGHQMLQKLGWKADEDNSDSNNHLKKDWKRIEALASSQNRR